jgi:A/G-specific adenine glycosylase
MKSDDRRLPGDRSKLKRQFQRCLLGWYVRNRRDLPWRRDHDPYRVWLSEIMLQQTRVAAVVEHYQRFLQRFPTVECLARARESWVLAAWSGLGYYRRARMLHAAAKQIVREHAGRFPTSVDGLRALPGIGRYTAAAVASIAFGVPVAVVDGNVERVLERFEGKRLAVETVWRMAEELLSRSRPGDFNQAMMELGATVCLPRQPLCMGCPVRELCTTRGELPKSEREIRIKREVYYALDYHDDAVLMVQRPKDASLMPGMWELPEVPAPRPELAKSNSDGELTLRHSITVTDFVVKVEQRPVPEVTGGRRVQDRRISGLPLTGLARKILRAAKII